MSAPVLSSLSVKIRRGEELRRVTIDGPLPPAFAVLAATIRSLFGLGVNAPIVLKYHDPEGDLITVSSDVELAEAVRLQLGTDRLLRLELTVPKPAAKPAAAAPVAAAPVAVAPAAPVAKKAAAKAAAIAKPAAAAPAPSSSLAVVPSTPALALATVPSPGKAEKVADKQQRQAEKAAVKLQHQVVKEQAKAEEMARKDDERTAKQGARIERLMGKLEVVTQLVEARPEALGLREEVDRLRSELQAAKELHKAAALGSGNQKAIMWARFVRDVSHPDGTVLQPGERFTKTWRFRNDLDKPWPPATRLLFVGKNSDRLGAPDEVLLAHSLPPGDEMDISVPLVAPAAPGRYTAYFRLASADGKKFGQRVWVIISVAGQHSSSSDEDNEPAPAPELLAQWRAELDVLAQLNFTNAALNVRLLRKHNGVLADVAAVLMRRRAMARKLAAKAAAVPAAPAPTAVPATPTTPATGSAPTPGGPLPLPALSSGALAQPSEKIE